MAIPLLRKGGQRLAVAPSLSVFFLCLLLLSVSVSVRAASDDVDALAPDTAPTSTRMTPVVTTEPPKSDEYQERILILGQQDTLRTEAGSTAVVDALTLETYRFDDIERVLSLVPGVNIRTEDGYGLRPNIGFRGVTPERSKKITLMEDGVLIAPAPYSAAAAYYFPMLSKVTEIEVFKGPAAIKYGPYTVAGALNLVTQPVPETVAALADVALGADGYQKTHGYVGQRVGNIGVLLEGARLASNGFKQLDGGGDTGFEKSELMAKLRYDTNHTSFDQTFELKGVYAQERSNETYLGLTDADFALAPSRRYVASQLDRMRWVHSQWQFSHYLNADKFDISTKIYRTTLSRAWRKINGFAQGPSLSDILQNPNSGINNAYYQVLTGAADSGFIDGSDALMIGTNDRDYHTLGAQSDWRWQPHWWGGKHLWEAGLRYHYDEIERDHTEDPYQMQAAALVRSGSEQSITLNKEATHAWSLYLQDTLTVGKLALTAGVRGEWLRQRYQNQAAGAAGDYLKKSVRIWLPGISAFYSISPQLGIFAGLHHGFVPTSPAQAPSIRSETSVNYEMGMRFHHQDSQFESTLFLNDVENLKESCTFSASATNCEIGTEYNGGEVMVYGLELSVQHLFHTGAIQWPLRLVYSYTKGQFEQNFESDFSLWGTVTKGDPLPYLPAHQLTLGLGMNGARWQLDLLARYQSAMWEAAGTGVVLAGVRTEPLWNVDLAATWQWTAALSSYVKVDNLLDERAISSRRPYGARPNKPRQWQLGVQWRY